MFGLCDFIIVCGHYGCGKTNLSVNLAVDLTREGKQVTIVDMDIVNPYFRSSEYRELFDSLGIRLISPSMAGSTLDTPALSPEIASIFETSGTVIIDSGGDDAGVTALGCYSSRIRNIDYDMLYVVNKYRPSTADTQNAAEILHEIERASRLRATGIVNNSHLMQGTTADTVRSSLSYAEAAAEILRLPIKFTTVPKGLADINIANIYPVERYVKTPWDN